MRLTQIAELIPGQEPATNGACDAAAVGMHLFRLQDGCIAPSGQQIQSQIVTDYLTSVGQKFANLESADSQLQQVW